MREISAFEAKGLFQSMAASKQRSGLVFLLRLPHVAIAALVVSVTLQYGQFLPTTQGSPSLPNPDSSSRAGPKLVLKAINEPGGLSPAYLAGLYDFVVLTAGNASMAQQIKNLNPNVTVLVYRTLHVVHTWVENWGTIKTHESWFMHDPSGNRTKVDTDEYVMDIRNSEYRAYQIRYMTNFLNTYGLDGMFWDGPPGTLKLLTLSPGPDPAASSTWHRDILNFLNEVKQGFRSRLVITNSTTTYDTGLPGADDTDYLRYVDGTMMEGFGHAPWFAATDPPSDWGYQQRMAQRNVSAGKIVATLSGIQLHGASTDQIHQWEIFSYASALLVADGAHVNFQWTPEGMSGNGGIIFPEMTVPLGSPLGPAYSSGGVTQRDFTGGKVVVNPSYSMATVTVRAGLHTLDGSINTKSSQQVQVSPWSALLLFTQ